MITSFRFSQSLKLPLPIDFMLSKENDVKFLHPANAALGISVTPSIVTLAIPESAKIPPPIEVIFAGSTISFKALHPLKASFPIRSTFPSSIFTSERFSQPSKTSCPISVTSEPIVTFSSSFISTKSPPIIEYSSLISPKSPLVTISSFVVPPSNIPFLYSQRKVSF